MDLMNRLRSFLGRRAAGGGAISAEKNRERLATLPQRFSLFDLALAWEVRTSGGETVVEGALQNRRYAFMEGIEIWVAALDAAGEVAARSVCYVIPDLVRQDEVAPFSVKLPVPAPPGTRLRFTYRYRGADGGEGGVSWSQSFESVVEGNT